MNSEPPLVCVDHAALSDLMFWEQMARALQQGGGSCPAPVILLGSSEQAEAAVGGVLSDGVRSGEEISVPVDAHAAFERAIREQNKGAVASLTDAGVSAVGLVGADRGLLVWNKDRLRAGAWHTVNSLAQSGVVCVVSCVASEGVSGTLSGPPSVALWRDVHPVRVARLVRAEMSWEFPYTVMAQSVTGSLPASGTVVEGGQIDSLVAEGGLLPGTANLIREPVQIAHSSRWSSGSKS